MLTTLKGRPHSATYAHMINATEIRVMNSINDAAIKRYENYGYICILVILNKTVSFYSKCPLA